MGRSGRITGKIRGWAGSIFFSSRGKKMHPLRNFSPKFAIKGFLLRLLLGMGGSSLCPEVLRKSFGIIDSHPDLHVLDSTDPQQIRSRERSIDIPKTLFFVSSKSGTTLEPNIFKQYFFHRANEVVGETDAGSHFVAITDPGSKLRQEAEHDRFRKIFLGDPSIGGRYSGLSDFGMAPAASLGIDVAKFLGSADEMVRACGADVAPKNNPGIILGAILGTAHNQGRDKITIIASPRIYDLGAWLEQLIAESTGKNGKGLIPVDRESLGAPSVYGDDRLFVYLRLESAPDPAEDAAIANLQQSGQPMVIISVADVYDLGQEFFRWEFATAVAGSIIGINPFDQPDVEASKIATRKLTEEYERTDSLPQELPFFEAQGIKLFADENNANDLNLFAGESSLLGYLKAHRDRLKPSDYFALLAYIEMTDAHEGRLQIARHA